MKYALDPVHGNFEGIGGDLGKDGLNPWPTEEEPTNTDTEPSGST